jgi:DNA-binding NtrC family response regulator
MQPLCTCGKVPGQPAKKSPRVLVIDDEPLIRWSLAAGLRMAGFEVLSAGDAATAVDLGSRCAPDVVLLDVRLWNTNTTQLLADLQRVAPEGRVLLLAVTGHEVPPSRFKDVEIVRKPYDLHEVVRTVEAAVAAVHRMKPAV